MPPKRSPGQGGTPGAGSSAVPVFLGVPAPLGPRPEILSTAGDVWHEESPVTKYRMKVVSGFSHVKADFDGGSATAQW